MRTTTRVKRRARSAPVPERARLGYLCDGCHSDPCYCDDIAAQRWEDYGPICDVCNGGSDNDYENCEFGASGVYEPGPGSPDTHGCPRMTGTF